MLNTSWVKSLKTPIAIIGLGKSGRSAQRFLKTIGFSDADLITYDDKDTSAQINSSDILLASLPKTIVVSPGVSLKTPWIIQLVSGGAFLTSEISLASSILTTEQIIGITGSVGKSTVTSLLGAGAMQIDPNCFVGGNLGIPFCDYACQILAGNQKASWVILELSSYQLENCQQLSLDYSAITFLSPNHLERYDRLDDYYQTKMKITGFTKNVCVLNKSSPDAVKYAPLAKCKTQLVNAASFLNQDLLTEVVLIGLHNKDNFAVATEVATLAGWKKECLWPMAHYAGLSHRLEYVGTVNGTKYINDSKSTAMDSVKVAAKGCLENIFFDSKLYLLLGGKDKNLPWEQLSIFTTESRIQCVFFGECGLLAKQKTGLSGPYFDKLGPALQYCYQNAKSEDTVLLSPGGTSLDEFKNFEVRGNFFKDFVNQKNAQR